VSTEIRIGGISEQDLDLFFLEEMIANSSFRAWLLSKIPGWPPSFDDLDAASRSVKYGDGEVDLEFTFKDPSRDSARLFIENKLTAGFQPYQLARYEKRGSDLLRSGVKHIAVALLAPKRYGSGSLGGVFPISYEDVHSWLGAQTPDARSPYKLRLLKTAIEKGTIGYNPVTDDPVTKFWLDYWREVDQLAPELEMRTPEGRPSGSAFAWFPCAMPGDLKLCHKLAKGLVDLHFRSMGDRVLHLRAALAPIIEPGMEVRKASKSAVVRIEVPPLSPTGLSVIQQEAAVRQGIVAAKRLYEWAHRNGSRLIEIERAVSAETMP